MLYETTRSKVATYTAQRALAEERAPDGGFYVPATLPVYSHEELEVLIEEPSGEIVARVLNAFFGGKLGRLDVEFALGKKLFGLARISHRILIGELWRNHEGSVDGICSRLAERLSAQMGEVKPGAWMRIAARIAFVFAMYAELRRSGTVSHTEVIDAAALTGDFEGPYALYTARKMGLPIGQIICCCNDNGGLWDLLNRGQMKMNARTVQTMTPDCDAAVPAGLELLIHDRLEWDEVEEFLELQSKGGTWYLSAEEHRHFREGLSAAVVSDSRIRRAIPNLFHTNGYILCPYSALVYTGIMDYRSHPGPRRAALMLTERDPRESADTVTRALAISDGELREWCQHR